MADDKNIEIKIAATGGDQSAAEVRKVETAADSLSGSGSSNKGLKALNDEGAKLTATNVRMGTGFQNVGFQVQDLAVQIGSGQSAFRALGQQLPQLLSGFGPLGVTLGTVAAVALPLAGAMFNLGNAAEEAGDKADEAADKLDKLTEMRQSKVDAAADTAFKAYLADLDLEFQALTRNSDAISGSIELRRAENRAKVEVNSAQAALDLAEIDASDKSETEKIKARAEVNKRVEREKLDAANEQSKIVIEQAKQAEENARLLAEKGAGNAGEVGSSLAQKQAEAASLRGRIIAADQAKAGIPELDKKIKYSSTPVPFIPGQEKLSGELELQRQVELEALQKKRAAQELAVGDVSSQDRQRLNTLQGSKREDGSFEGGEIEDTKKALQDLVSKAATLGLAAQKASLDAAKTQQSEVTAATGRSEAFDRRVKTIDVTTGSAATAEEKQQKDKALEKKQRAELERREEGLDDTARGAAGKFTRAGGNVGGKVGGSLQDIGNKLADGTNQAEIDQLAQKFIAATEGFGGATKAALLQMFAEMQKQAKEVAGIKKKLKLQ